MLKSEKGLGENKQMFKIQHSNKYVRILNFMANLCPVYQSVELYNSFYMEKHDASFILVFGSNCVFYLRILL